MPASDLTLLLAFGAGIISFISPCVLPLVPAYLAQLTVVAVVRGEDAAAAGSSRWLAVRHALAYVLGFAAVFTFLGVSASLIGGGLYDLLPTLRMIGGLLLIVMGLNLAGILTVPTIQRVLQRTWRPLEAGAAGELARASGTISFGGRLDGSRGPGSGSDWEDASSAGAAAGSRRSGSGSFSRSAGPRVSGSSWGASSPWPRRPGRPSRAASSSSRTAWALASRSWRSRSSTTGRRRSSGRWSATGAPSASSAASWWS